MAQVLERSPYQTDYYAWTKQQAAPLRALAARKLEHSPAAEPRFGWRESVIEARDTISEILRR